MHLLELNIQYRVLIGVAAMVLLFASFLVVFISSQRRKLQYHKSLHALHDKQQQLLTEQNIQLEKSVQERTLQISQQKEELERSLTNLKSTQRQLIQTEKMASLGELTAGIAHEIQNPLNFVKNFSEVSKEMAEEMEKELEAGNREEALSISKVLKENLQKIEQHGKRAEAIVHGMLQHSRVSSGDKEPADLNNLADEYLRLTYQTVRMKNKGFLVKVNNNFDKNLGQTNVYPQDLTRVFINLYNNAFYSMQEKKRLSTQPYEPELIVSTKKQNGKIEISIKDNGMGIPEKTIRKIFQPFFTTKPTGQGTGLGLSLSYDTIVRGHGGDISVNTSEGEGAEFVIHLPA